MTMDEVRGMQGSRSQGMPVAFKSCKDKVLESPLESAEGTQPC